MKLVYFILAIVLVSSVNALTAHIYHDKGDFVVTYDNQESKRVKDLQVSVYVPDLDIYEKSSEFYVRSNSKGKVYVFTDLEEGYYPVIVRMQNDNGLREKKHTWFIN